MRPCKKVIYYTFKDFMDATPFVKFTMKSVLMWAFDLEDESDLSGYQIPSDLTTNAAIYNELISLLYGRYWNENMIKVETWPNQEPSEDDVHDSFREWGFRFVSKLNMTYEYYVPLLTMYRNAKANLMDDVESTSSNKIKFNDTPQNANTSGVYEGDDYINQFTKTEGLTKTQLTSKINRLREIQDGYKNVMADWVKEFEMLFMEDNH